MSEINSKKHKERTSSQDVPNAKASSSASSRPPGQGQEDFIPQWKYVASYAIMRGTTTKYINAPKAFDDQRRFFVGREKLSRITELANIRTWALSLYFPKHWKKVAEVVEANLQDIYK